MPKLIVDWEPYKRNDGKDGRLVAVQRWYTPLITCDLCGLTSTPKRIQYRHSYWNVERGDYITKPLATLCMGCWNKVRPLEKKKKAAEAAMKTINRYRRLLRESTKNATGTD